MTLTDVERNEALLRMIASGAFADDLALTRWSVTEEAVPILRKWLVEGRARRGYEADFDLDAAHREIAAQDALAADIQARFGPNEQDHADAQTINDMFHLGWFGQGPAFWRWIEAPAARPFIAVCAEMRRAPGRDELFDAFGPSDNATRVINDPDLLAKLAAWIEAEYGGSDRRPEPDRR